MKRMLLSCLIALFLIIGHTDVPTTLYSAANADIAGGIYPLPDATMESLSDAILHVSFGAGDVYLDDTGKLQMKVKIYVHDAYDLLDIALLQTGDRLFTHAGELEVIQIEHKEDGTVCINGGWEANGLSLMANDSGFYYPIGFSGAIDWYEIGEATLRVSVDFMGYDQIDPALGEIIIYPGDFLVNAVTNYDFSPWNTTIRTENGQVVELHRMLIP